MSGVEERAPAALWCKSHFSFLEGASAPAELVARAGELGLGAVAVTDSRASRAPAGSSLPILPGRPVRRRGPRCLHRC